MIESRQYADAIPQLEAAYAKIATQANRVALARALLLAGSWRRRLRCSSRRCSAEPGELRLADDVAMALRDRKQFPPAAAQFLEAAKSSPPEPQTGRIWRHAVHDRGVSAVTGGVRPGAGTGRQLGGNQFFRAIILDKLKQLKPALEAYQKFLTLSKGEHPDQEFQARQRARILQRELEKR